LVCSLAAVEPKTAVHEGNSWLRHARVADYDDVSDNDVDNDDDDDDDRL